MKNTLCIFIVLITFESFSQGAEVYEDLDGKRYTSEEVAKIRQSDQFITIIKVRETDTIFYKIIHYDKELVASRFQKDGFYCGNINKKLTTKEINERFPFFAQTATIKLTSFRNENPEEHDAELPRKKGKINMRKMHEVVTLNKDLTDKLLDLLINYDNPSDNNGVILCYEPRNAIIFCDRENEIIGAVEICFECHRFKAEPPNLPLGQFCNEKFDVLQGFFRSAGIQFGTRRFNH
jgi:hypothetical protein